MKKKTQAKSSCKESETLNFADASLGTLGKKNLVRDEKQTRKIQNSTTFDDKQNKTKKKTKKNSINRELPTKLLFAHNIGWKFPLKKTCSNPFNPNLSKTGLRNNSQYLLSTKQGFLRQTTKNLIIYPSQIPGPLKAGSAKQLLEQSRARAFAWVKSLQSTNSGLKVYAALAEPITKEFAVKDAFAERVKYTFRASNGVKIDKSVHLDESGHKTTGKELDFPTIEQADDYCNLPNHFRDAVKLFSQSLASYNANIKLHNANIELHLSTLQEMKNTLRFMARTPKTRHFRGSAKKSATYKGCS